MPGRIPMTTRQRAALLMLPDDEAAIVKHYSLSGEDMTAIDTARTPATRLGYALQLCCLRYRAGICATGNCCLRSCSTILPSRSGWMQRS
ncbi:DUF4158 domain-containing protein [Sphingobium fuliginis]|uniref:Mobile element protein n=1 Tax=Sphingobium fuliginis (strain ATCC 27551) TaxID=336203 RepID=A0A292ZP19_SPHSA|nr:DUF4158 domain-containing protein [Sphingobium fuliginis]GAY24641.1 mobile element protein [Sphingobium fuliginis]